VSRSCGFRRNLLDHGRLPDLREVVGGEAEADGDLSGVVTVTDTIVGHGDGSLNEHGTDTCTSCTIGGRTGSFTAVFEFTGANGQPLPIGAHGREEVDPQRATTASRTIHGSVRWSGNAPIPC
jgi:hypothetical protein